MLVTIGKTDTIDNASNRVFLCGSKPQIEALPLSKEETDYVAKQFDEESVNSVTIDKLSNQLIIVFTKKTNVLEKIRIEGSKIGSFLNKKKAKSVSIIEKEQDKSSLISFLEGLLLGNYQFIKYFSDKEKKRNSLEDIRVVSDSVTDKDIENLLTVIEAVCYCRDFVNEPACFLSAEKFASDVQKMGTDAGIKTEILNQSKIEALKMGGLVSVNKGSSEPATFTIMEWNPENKVNNRPIVLVGKGVMFDSGGMNLKPDDYMNDMKGDMAGAATMAGVLYAVAKNKLPVHVVALLPATDNRPGEDAFVSGDVITMHDGTTVEVINTDAEGRLILADALSYAKQYNPELVIDAATLTGAAQRAIGKYGIVAMQNNASKYMEELKQSGEETHERIAEFPFWEEYNELIKSNIADIQNIGGKEAGMITAGKFLAHFTNYPYIHLDIAGVGFYEKAENYYSVGGTGYGIRLLYDFIEKKSLTKDNTI